LRKCNFTVGLYRGAGIADDMLLTTSDKDLRPLIWYRTRGFMRAGESWEKCSVSLIGGKGMSYCLFSRNDCGASVLLDLRRRTVLTWSEPGSFHLEVRSLCYAIHRAEVLVAVPTSRDMADRGWHAPSHRSWKGFGR
jgi:hypothetical protein